MNSFVVFGLPLHILINHFVVVLVVWYRFVLGSTLGERMPRLARRASVALVAVAAVVIAVGSVIDVVLIGDAGARAVWGGLFAGISH